MAERAKQRCAYAAAEHASERAARAAAKVTDNSAERMRALECLGDVVSLKGELERANEGYHAALAHARSESDRRRIGNKLHQPRSVIRDGKRIVFYEHGSGRETLLVTNPIVYGLEIFQPVLENLCQEFRIIIMAARGTGQSDPVSPGYGCGDHAADVRAVIEAAGGGPMTVIGISKSGNIMVRLAAAAPGLVKKLVLVGTPLDVQPGCMSLVRSETDDRFREAMRAGDWERALPLFAATIVTDPGTEELLEQFSRTLLSLPRETVVNNWWIPDPTADIAPLLDQVKAPTLVVHGTQDRRVSVAAARHLSEHIPDAQLYLFEGHGHLPIFTATAEFCDVLRRFVTMGGTGVAG